MKRTKYFLSIFSMVSPIVVSTACSANQQDNSNSLLNSQFEIPKGNVISYFENQVFWAGINSLIESNQLSNNSFIETINRSNILESNLAPIPAGGTINIIDKNSSFDIELKTDKLVFNIVSSSATRRYELRWSVSLSDEEYLDAWLAKIPSFNLTTNLNDHNRLFAFIRDVNDQGAWSETVYTNRLFEYISDLQDNFSIPQFNRSTLLVKEIKPVRGTFGSLSNADLSNGITDSGLMISLNYATGGQVFNREILFDWKIDGSQMSSSLWLHTSKLKIGLTDFNSILNRLQLIDQSSIANLDLYRANSLIDIIKPQIGSQTLNGFESDVYLRAVYLPDKLLGNSIQETIRLVVSQAGEFSNTLRQVKIDFEVSASNSEILESWIVPQGVHRITPEALSSLVFSLRQLELLHTQSTVNIFWASLSKSLPGVKLSKFPANVGVMFNKQQLENIGALSDGKNVRLSFKLTLGAEEKSFTITYVIEATEQEELDRLNLNYFYALSDTEFEDLRVALTNLPVGASAAAINDAFNSNLPTNLMVPVFPDFVILQSRISLQSHSGSQSVRDLVISVSGSNPSARRTFNVARIHVARDAAVLLDAMVDDSGTSLLNAMDYDDILESFNNSISLGKTSPVLLSRIFRNWKALENVPTGSIVSNIDFPTGMVLNNDYEIKVQITLREASKEVIYRFKYVTSYEAAGFVWKAPTFAKISSEQYLRFARFVSTLDLSESQNIQVLRPEFNALFASVSGYVPPEDALGSISKLSSLPLALSLSSKYLEFSFVSTNAYVSSSHTVSLEIEDTPAQSIDAWSSLLPASFNFGLSAFNEWYAKFKNMDVRTNEFTNQFINSLYAFTGSGWSPQLNQPAYISSWSLSDTDFALNTKSVTLTLNLVNGSASKVVNIRLNIAPKNDKEVLENYFKSITFNQRHLKLTATQFNSLAALINGTTYRQFSIFANAFNAYVGDSSLHLPLIPGASEFKLENQLEYQLIDFAGNYSSAVSFRFNNSNTSVYQVVFTFEVVPDYQQVVSNLTTLYATTTANHVITYENFLIFMSNFNAMVQLPNSYLKNLRLNALLTSFGLIDESAISVNGISYTVSEIPFAAINQDVFAFSFYYSAPGVNQQVANFSLNITKSLKQQLDDLQVSIPDTNITLTNLNAFISSWNALSATATSAQILAVLNTRFASFNLPTGTMLRKTGVISLNPINGEGGQLQFDNLFTFSVDVIQTASPNNLVSLLYFNFILTVDDNAVVQMLNMPVYSVTGTRKRLMDFKDYATQTSVLGLTGRTAILNKLKELFGANITLPLSGINFRTIEFTGSWNSSSEISQSNKIVITYGYNNSLDTKKLTLNVRISTDFASIIEDFSTIKTNEVTNRSFYDLQDNLFKATTTARIDEIFLTYVPIAQRPEFVKNWGTNLTLVNILRRDTNLKYEADGTAKGVFLIILKHVENGLTNALSIELVVNVRYDYSDQTDSWSVRSNDSSLHTSELIAAQTFFNEKYAPGSTVTNISEFLRDLNDKLLRKDLSSIVPFPSTSQIIIPETGLIDGNHLYFEGSLLTVDFTLSDNQKEFEPKVQFVYERSTAYLFSLYTPFFIPSTVTDTVEMLYSEYQEFFDNFILLHQSALNDYVNIESVWGLIEDKLIDHGFVKQSAIPFSGSFQVYVSSYETLITETELVNNDYTVVNVSVGAMSKGSAEIRIFKFKIKIKMNLTDIAKTKLVNSVWRGIEQNQFSNLAQQRKFFENLNLYNPNVASSKTNLMTPEKFKEKVEGELGVIVGDSFTMPKPAGNQEIMYGFTKKTPRTKTLGTPFTIRHEEDGEYNEFKPLTKTLREVLNKTTVEEIEDVKHPGFVDDPSLHPWAKPQKYLPATVSMGVAGIGAMGYAGYVSHTTNVYKTRLEDEVVKGLWVQFYKQHRGGDKALIPFRHLNQAIKERRYPPSGPGADLSQDLEYHYGASKPIGTGTTPPPTTPTIGTGTTTTTTTTKPPTADGSEFTPAREPGPKLDVVSKKKKTSGLAAKKAKEAGVAPKPSATVGDSGAASRPSTHSDIPASLEFIHKDTAVRKFVDADFLSSRIPDSLIITPVGQKHNSDYSLYSTRPYSTGEDLVTNFERLSLVAKNSKSKTFFMRIDPADGIPEHFLLGEPKKSMISWNYPDRIFLNNSSIVPLDLGTHLSEYRSISKSDFESGKVALYAQVVDNPENVNAIFKSAGSRYHPDVDVLTPGKFQRVASAKPSHFSEDRAEHLAGAGHRAGPSDAAAGVGDAPAVPPRKTKPVTNPKKKSPKTSDVDEETSGVVRKIERTGSCSSRAPGNCSRFEYELMSKKQRARVRFEGVDTLETTRSDLGEALSDSTSAQHSISVKPSKISKPRAVTLSAELDPYGTSSALSGKHELSLRAGRVEINEVKSTSRFSAAWTKRIKYAAAGLGAILTIGGFIMSLWQGGIIGQSKSNHVDNDFDGENETKVVNTAVVNDFEFGAFLVTRNSSNEISTAELIETYQVRLNSSVLDYSHQSGQTSYSKPLDFIVDEFVKVTNLDQNTLKAKVNVSSSEAPAAYRRNSGMVSGSWLGYLQLYPILQTLDSIEVGFAKK